MTSTLKVNKIEPSSGGVVTAGEYIGFAGIHADVSSGSEVYTVPTGVTKLLVFLTGGGGGGGDGDSVQGWGGVGGTTVIARVTVVAGDTITIAVGAGGTVSGSSGYDGNIGGDSTFTHTSGSGSFDTITAPGGKPGRNAAATVAPAAGTVGSSNEGISILGGYGWKEGIPNGGSSFWGGGGQGAVPSIQVAVAGTAYGSGGGGGSSTSSYLSSAAGAAGVCLIMEFR